MFLNVPWPKSQVDQCLSERWLDGENSASLRSVVKPVEVEYAQLDVTCEFFDRRRNVYTSPEIRLVMKFGESEM